MELDFEKGPGRPLDQLSCRITLPLEAHCRSCNAPGFISENSDEHQTPYIALAKRILDAPKDDRIRRVEDRASLLPPP
jgi:hypothetical protein